MVSVDVVEGGKNGVRNVEMRMGDIGGRGWSDQGIVEVCKERERKANQRIYSTQVKNLLA